MRIKRGDPDLEFTPLVAPLSTINILFKIKKYDLKLCVKRFKNQQR
jgi:hypothetical protein